MIPAPHPLRFTVMFHAGVGEATSGGIGGGPGGGIGSPLYDVPSEHMPVLVLLVLLPVIAGTVMLLAPRWPMAARLRDGYLARPPLHRLALWLIAVSAVVHVGLIGHHEGFLAMLMLLDGLLLTGVVALMVTGRRWRLPAGILLAGSLIAWWLVTMGGEVPDQLGVLTKLAELAALAIVLTPTSGARIRGAAASMLVIVLVVVTDAAAWAGALGGGAADGGATDGGATDGGATDGGAADRMGGGHHGGGLVTPGTLLGADPDRPPTEAETATAEAMWLAAYVALLPYRDPSIAIADGYEVDGVFGLDFHAGNPAYRADGRILDPARPEDLIYAQGPNGPVLLGAMFEMPDGSTPGPDFGGPAAVWHAHEHVCFGILPLGLTGLLSPLGGCPVGSVDITRTPQMIHVWVADGTPVHWGELDDTWKADYVAKAS